MNILITGATGFIGQTLCKKLLESGYSVHAAVKSIPYFRIEKINYIALGEFTEHTNWSSALHNIDVVIHTAARVHKMNENSSDPLLEYRRINTAMTLNLFQQAAKAKVKKFIFISSIKVNGEETFEYPFKEFDDYVPTDPYALSKWEAEQGIAEMVKQTNLNYTIVRLPLVYGEGVKANFANLIKLVKLHLPLPFGSIKNKRSFLYIRNVCFLSLCVYLNGLVF